MDVLIGLIGVLAGAGIASGFGFWITRRHELASAVVTATIVADELVAVRSALEQDFRSARTLARVSSVSSFWMEHRGALVLYLMHPKFLALNETIRLVAEFASLEADIDRGAVTTVIESVDETLGWLEPRTSELREAHQAFILTPVVKYLSTSPWRSK